MDLYHVTPVVLDGGFGTTLESIFNVDISHTPLWSAKASAEKPETVVASHLMFLRAGAQIILTSTYQCSINTYRRAGYSDTDAVVSMHNAVLLAGEAKTTYAKEDPDRVIEIALSLGPFGASLTPAQDFDGHYPPPFGPAEYSASTKNCNSFGGDMQMENEAVEALAKFHLRRLLIFARDPIVWRTISCIAFETIPLAREVKAVRRAMSWLPMELAAEDVVFQPKPWWISFVFPNGQCSENYPGMLPITVRDMVSAAFQWKPRPVKDIHEGTTVMPIPSGVGINCTPLEFFPTLVDEMTKAINDVKDLEDSKPWLVLYPNNGDIYDPVSRTWSVRKHVDGRSWAVDFGELLREISNTAIPGTWAGVVGGGCCRTLPEDIAVLSKIVTDSGQRRRT